MNKVVIIGAGLSGRGYLNRLFYLSKQKVTFLDKNKQLIDDLQKRKGYYVSFGKERETLYIDNYDAFIFDEEAISILADADLIMISVGANHVKELLDPLKRSLSIRIKKDIDIITAENGIHVSKALKELKKDSRVHLSEAIIFCTTLGGNESIDILSEDLDHLPYNQPSLTHELNYYGFVSEKSFEVLLQRKIYTYNCISACIAYLGYRKGYESYAEAANDEIIDKKIRLIAEVLNKSIANSYGIPLDEQIKFSEMAIRKFKNKNIVDTIERNVRDVERKLGVNERLIAPLNIIQEHGGYSDELLEVCACALCYGIDSGTLSKIENSWNTYFDIFPKEWQETIKNKVNEIIES